MNCEKCNKEQDGKYGSGRFCSSKCARGFSTKSKRQEINQKVSKKMIGHIPWNKDLTLCRENKKCLFCGEEIFWRRKFCSNSCSQRFAIKDSDYIKRLSEQAKKTIKRKEALGIPCGWMVLKHKTSYAEKFFIKVLDENNIKYKYNVKCGLYRIDFVINKNFALEIDGKQHEWPERKASDLRKDKYLRSRNYRVHRIKWRNINSVEGKKYIAREINNLFLLI